MWIRVGLLILNKPIKQLLPTHSAASTSSNINNMIDVINVKLDSGVTRHYFKEEHKHILDKLKHLIQGPVAQLLDNSRIRATYEGILNLHPSLSRQAQKVLIYPALKSESLLRGCQLANDGCDIHFSGNLAQISKNNKRILQGSKNLNDRLYDIQLPQSPAHKMNYIIQKDKPKTDVALYLHATAFSPPMSQPSKKQ